MLLLMFFHGEKKVMLLKPYIEHKYEITLAGTTALLNLLLYNKNSCLNWIAKTSQLFI